MALFHGFVERLPVADDARFDHLAQQVVALTGALAHAGKDREAVVLLGDIVDQLLDEHGLAYARAAEQSDLAALEIGFQQVDDLDAGEEHFLRSGEVLELRGLAVDGQGAFPVELRHAVDGAAHHVHHAAADLAAYGHGDGGAGAADAHAAPQAVGRIHGHGADGVFAQVLLHFQGEGRAVLAGYLQGFMDGGKPLLLFFRQGEMDIDDRADDLGNASGKRCHRGL